VKSRRPPFIVVSGAHGVGKTTAVGAATSSLEKHGVAVRCFHHILDTATAKDTKCQLTKPANKPRVWSWRRAVPQWAKMLVTSTFNELRYWRRIDSILADAARENQIALADRYAYDRLVDIRLRQRPLIQRAVLRIVSGMMRRPTLTILLTDDATAIYQRKQELSIDEIERYQEELASICRHMHAPLKVIAVNGRSAEEISQEVFETVIEAAQQSGHDLPLVLSVAPTMAAACDPTLHAGRSH
jgi:thymidylate kinase